MPLTGVRNGIRHGEAAVSDKAEGSNGVAPLAGVSNRVRYGEAAVLEKAAGGEQRGWVEGGGGGFG